MSVGVRKKVLGEVRGSVGGMGKWEKGLGK